MKHPIPHDLDRPLARRATRAALDTYRVRFAAYSPFGRWTSLDRAEIGFQAAGQTIQGTVEVGEDAVELDLEVPLLLRPFRKLAVEAIEKEVQIWIERAKAGELPETEDDADTEELVRG